MANNPKSEILAYEEGRNYFEDPNCKPKTKYKHCICSFNSAYWWFRDKSNLKTIITDKIISDEYLKNIIPKYNNKTRNLYIYYYEISKVLDINLIKNEYKEYDIKFIKINKKPSDYIIYRTIKGNVKEWHTLCLIDGDTSIFDVKNFGIMKEYDGKNMRVYRIKDKNIYNDLYNQFLNIK